MRGKSSDRKCYELHEQVPLGLGEKAMSFRHCEEGVLPDACPERVEGKQSSLYYKGLLWQSARAAFDPSAQARVTLEKDFKFANIGIAAKLYAGNKKISYAKLVTQI